MLIAKGRHRFGVDKNITDGNFKVALALILWTCRNVLACEADDFDRGNTSH